MVSVGREGCGVVWILCIVRASSTVFKVPEKCQSVSFFARVDSVSSMTWRFDKLKVKFALPKMLLHGLISRGINVCAAIWALCPSFNC